MGQLERYGLYVLCLVIFLILGVAIWGGDPPASGAVGQSLVKELEQASNPIQEEPLPQSPAGEAMTLSRLLDASSSTEIEGFQETMAPPETRFLEEPAPPKEIEAPVATQARYYVIQKGDSLSVISQRELGAMRRWPEIQALNPEITDERMLIPGERLLMPSRGLDAPMASGQQYSLYRVMLHDNPSKISMKLFGTEAFYKQILALNPGMDPKRMKTGSEIRVPLRK